MRIALYAPLKAPDHAVPSGDRSMARLLMSALSAAGHDVELASSFRSFEGAGDGDRQRAIQAAGAAEAARLAAAYQAVAPERRPQAWLTYHLYHKAPDWLGPSLSRALAIPYLIAEACHAPKQAAGPWAAGHAAAAEAIARAQTIFCLTAVDRICVAPLMDPAAGLHLLPPFLDHRPLAQARRHRSAARAALAGAFGLDASRPWLLAVAMMRPGDKLRSYQRLGAALATLGARDWHLLVVGEGPARERVEEAFAPLGTGRVAFLGSRSGTDLAGTYAACDLYVWPAVREAYGMAVLEAQAAGLPVVAGREGGVPEIVRDGETGLLVAGNDAAGFAAAVGRLLDDDGLRRRLGRRALQVIAGEHGIARAAAGLDQALRALSPPLAEVAP